MPSKGLFKTGDMRFFVLPTRHRPLRQSFCPSHLQLLLQSSLADKIRRDSDQSHAKNNSKSDTSLGTASESTTTTTV